MLYLATLTLNSGIFAFIEIVHEEKKGGGKEAGDRGKYLIHERPLFLLWTKFVMTIFIHFPPKNMKRKHANFTIYMG